MATTVILLAITGVLYVLNSAAAAPGEQMARVEFTADGKLKQPQGYRDWVYIGTPLTPNDLNGGKANFPEFHAVYIDPESLAHFKKTGEFPDGAVLIKELVLVGAKEAASGNGYFMGDFTGLDAAIKDSKRFKSEPGNWGYFKFGHTYPLQKETALQATSTCNACHEANAKTDYVFTQYYPVLRAAMPRTK
jgi:hypothetical protein